MRPVQPLRFITAALVAGAALISSVFAQDSIRIGLPGEGDTLDPAYMSYVNSFSIASKLSTDSATTFFPITCPMSVIDRTIS